MNMMYPVECQLNSFFAQQIDYMKQKQYPRRKIGININNLKRRIIQRNSNLDSNKQIKKYDGQPSIRQYFQNQLESNQFNQYQIIGLINRNMKRLTRAYLPQLLYLYQRWFTQIKLTQVEIINNQSNLLDECTVRGVKDNKEIIISQNDSNSCLLAPQTIGFIKITQQKFKSLINIQNTIKILQKMKIQSKMSKKHIKKFNQQVNHLQQIIFELFTLPGLQFIIWPCLVLQPIIGSIQRVKQVAINNKVQINHDAQYLFEGTLYNYFLNMSYLQNLKNLNPSFDQRRLIQGLKYSIQNNQNNCQFIVKLIGVDAILFQYNIYEWNIFNKLELQMLIYKTPFESLIEEINQKIICLNKFKQYQKISVVNSKDSLYRFCKLKSNICCIPVKINRQNKQLVLIKKLQPNQIKGQQYEWVQLKYLTINYTFPRHSPQQRKFYNLFLENLTIIDVVSLLYSNYFNRNFTYQTYLQKVHQKQQIVGLQRCPTCYYYVRNQQQQQKCKNCKKNFHLCCTLSARQRKTQKQMKTKIIKKNDPYWICEMCQICKICYTGFTNNNKPNLVCEICYLSYHYLCGRLSITLIDYNKYRFVCQFCQICSSCLRQTPISKIVIINQTVLCIDCNIDKNRDCCSLCQQQISNKQYISCKTAECRQYLHQSCFQSSRKDSYKFNLDKFKCNKCIIGIRRSLIEYVLREIKNLDEDDYFIEPTFEDISQYQKIIKTPICLVWMQQKIHQGYYDNNTQKKLLQDFELLTKNALRYNMPKAQIHFKAKLIYIVSQKLIDAFSQFLALQDYQLLDEDIILHLDAQKQKFLDDIDKNLVKYMLNYGEDRNRIVVVNNPRVMQQIQSQTKIYSLRNIIQRTMKNCSFQFELEPYSFQIDQLFKVSKLIKASWNNPYPRLCYYHPSQKLPVIYECPICWETFCCTNKCFLHSYCKFCKSYGCDCNFSACGCSPLTQTEHKRQQRKIKDFLIQNKLSKLEYTQFHRYCLICVKQLERTCYLCNKFSCFGYEKCKFCDKIYHIGCQKNLRMNNNFKKYEIQQFYDQFRNKMKLNKSCLNCTKKFQYQHFLMNMNNTANYFYNIIKKIQIKLPIFIQIYKQLGYRLNENQILKIIFNRYDKYKKLIPQIQTLHLKINRLNIIQDYIIQCAQQIANFQYNYKNQQFLSISIQDYYQQQYKEIIYDHNIADNILLIQQSIRIHNIRKKYFYQTQQLPKIYPLYISSFINKVQINLPIIPYFQSRKIKQLYQENLKFRQEINKNLSFKYLYNIFEPKNIRKGICVSQNFRLIQTANLPITLPETLPKQMNKIPCLFEGIPQISELVSSFAIDAYQVSKLVLCKGNTRIIRSQMNDWKVQKYFNNKIFQIHLKKDIQFRIWTLTINKKEYYIQSIHQMIKILRQYGATIKDFDSLVHFLGFTLADPVLKNSNHFTRMLKTKQYYQLNSKQRRQKVLQIYDSFEWLNNGFFKCKKTQNTYRVTKVSPYYLNKRKIQLKDQNDQQNNKKFSQIELKQIKPFINSLDIKVQICSRYEAKQQIPAYKTPNNNVYIAPSSIDRLGLFMGEDIEKDTIIVEYLGEIISEPIADLRQKYNKYGCYLFALADYTDGTKQIIDSTHIGNKSRYLNHSCDPNCQASVVETEQQYKLIIFALRDIKKGQQLTYDYQFPIESSQTLGCKCGSVLCQGRLN